MPLEVIIVNDGCHAVQGKVTQDSQCPSKVTYEEALWFDQKMSYRLSYKPLSQKMV